MTNQNENHDGLDDRHNDSHELLQARATAYALGQLSEQECAAFEELLASDESLQEQIGSDRQLADAILVACHEEETAMSARGSIDAVLAALEYPSAGSNSIEPISSSDLSPVIGSTQPFFKRRGFFAGLTAIAMTACLVLVAYPYVRPMFQSPVALNEAEATVENDEAMGIEPSQSSAMKSSAMPSRFGSNAEISLNAIEDSMVSGAGMPGGAAAPPSEGDSATTYPSDLSKDLENPGYLGAGSGYPGAGAGYPGGYPSAGDDPGAGAGYPGAGAGGPGIARRSSEKYVKPSPQPVQSSPARQKIMSSSSGAASPGSSGGQFAGDAVQSSFGSSDPAAAPEMAGGYGFGGGGAGFGGGGGGLGGRGRRMESKKEGLFGQDRRGGRVAFEQKAEMEADRDRASFGRGWGKSGEQYEAPPENQFIEPIETQALSTFAVDVDTASYSNIRRFLQNGQIPPPNAVRLEEMVNYFNYKYPQPEGVDEKGNAKPFSVNTEIASCPWNTDHRLVRVGLKGREIEQDKRPATNLVFLLDVSGSMRSHDKLPLLKKGLLMLVDRLGEDDTISIVTYAGNAGVKLLPTNGTEKIKIRDAINSLNSGGSTNGSAGIRKAYELARENFVEKGCNRVLLGTDGDLNVGITNDSDLVDLIKEEANSGVFLTVLGFGTGNLKNAKMEKIADNGNGNYAYIDSAREAHKVLVEQMSGSLVTIAKNVKIQVEFNPQQVGAYRLLGYENRVMAAREFRNNLKDAGEIGAGHTVTAFYEVVPKQTFEKLAAKEKAKANALKPRLKYQQNQSDASADVEPKEESANAKVKAKTNVKAKKDAESIADSDESFVENAAEKLAKEMFTVRLRYMSPDQVDLTEKGAAIEFEQAAIDEEKSFRDADEDFRFAASVISLGLHLKRSQYRGNVSLSGIEELASTALGEDESGYRAEFLSLVRKAMGR